MDKLFGCARAFGNLLTTKYHIVIGRKGKTIDIDLVFTKWDFHHLMGLGKLKDLRLARQNRKDVFDEIIAKKYTYETLCASRHILEISDRFHPLAHIEQLLDDNNIVFRYNEKQNTFSLIQADFLLSTPLEENDVYIFIAENKVDGTYFCRSFFPKSDKDYTLGQTKYTLLYKEKINIATGESVVQFDRLNK